jgi:hypothetical protein
MLPTRERGEVRTHGSSHSPRERIACRAGAVVVGCAQARGELALQRSGKIDGFDSTVSRISGIQREPSNPEPHVRGT